MVWQKSKWTHLVMVRNFTRLINKHSLNILGDVLVIMNLRADDSLLGAGSVRQVLNIHFRWWPKSLNYYPLQDSPATFHLCLIYVTIIGCKPCPKAKKEVCTRTHWFSGGFISVHWWRPVRFCPYSTIPGNSWWHYIFTDEWVDVGFSLSLAGQTDKIIRLTCIQPARFILPPLVLC